MSPPSRVSRPAVDIASDDSKASALRSAPVWQLLDLAVVVGAEAAAVLLDVECRRVVDVRSSATVIDMRRSRVAARHGAAIAVALQNDDA